MAATSYCVICEGSGYLSTGDQCVTCSGFGRVLGAIAVEADEDPDGPDYEDDCDYEEDEDEDSDVE